MTDTPQSSDIRTTQYTIKANFETTRYFVSPETDIEHQVNENTEDIAAINAQLLLKENITDHDSDISTLQAAINSKESILAHNTDISTLQTNINLKEDITDHAADIATINSALSTKESTTDHAADIAEINSALSTKVSLPTYNTAMSNIHTNFTMIDSILSDLDTSVSTKESSSAHAADIQYLQNQINAIQPGTSYEGMYKPQLKNNSTPGVILN